jgi:hypothetical protein
MLDEQIQLPGFPAPDAETLPPGSTLTLALKLIVRDPALQCRSALDEATVLRYVDVVDELPPVRVILVETPEHHSLWKHYLVDGWHRFEAHVRAGRTVIRTVVDVGDRRAAILAAVKANSSHGLPRSHEDTRRAVKVLLMDEQWCKLSDRKLAELADVSHTHVANQRKQYGVKTGAVLSAEQANRIDGKLPPEWEAIKAKVPYAGQDLDKLRAVTAPAQLAKLRPQDYSTHLMTAFDLRATEMATKPWPWAEDIGDDGAIKARFERLDTVQDLLAAAESNILLPTERAAAYRLVDLAGDIERKFWLDGTAGLRESFAGRPALLARLEVRVGERRAEDAAVPRSDHALARDIEDEKSPLKQAQMVSDCSNGVFRLLDGWDLLPVVRDGNFKLRWAHRGDWSHPEIVLEACPVPGCNGFVRPEKETYYQLCTTCKQGAPQWRDETRKALARVATLLKHKGYGFKVGMVIIDARTIAAIEEIKVNASATISMKGGLGKPCRALVSQPEPTIMFVDNKPPPPAPEDEADEDIDEDSEAYQDGCSAFDLDPDAEVLQYATAREQRNFLAGFAAAKEEDEGATQ